MTTIQCSYVNRSEKYNFTDDLYIFINLTRTNPMPRVLKYRATKVIYNERPIGQENSDNNNWMPNHRVLKVNTDYLTGCDQLATHTRHSPLFLFVHWVKRCCSYDSVSYIGYHLNPYEYLVETLGDNTGTRQWMFKDIQLAFLKSSKGKHI